MLTSIKIENFTVFQKAEFEFVPGINVLIGANASGKTHLLKLLYAIQKAKYSVDEPVPRALLDVFRPERGISNLIRLGSESTIIYIKWDDVQYGIQAIKNEQDILITSNDADWGEIPFPVSIPVKDMLAHSVGFLSLYDQRTIDFDETYRDILSLAFTPRLRNPLSLDYEKALELLSEKLGGSVEVQGERLYLSGANGRIEMHMVAEGWRKIALLYQLIANGSISPGTVLYWDEPEANLNPSLMDELIRVLLIIARNGTQVFLATHSYIILKELELQKQESDSLRLFAMERNSKTGAVTPHAASSYSELTPNLIAEQFERIYDLEVDRALRAS